MFPAELLAGSANYRPSAAASSPTFGVWAHICGSDLVRDADGTMYVLEDNLRVPSGVSYVLENRLISKRAFADLFERQSILPVDAYTDELYKLLTSLAPDGSTRAAVVVLTPGIFNSAYFEHSFLAQRMGVPARRGRRPRGRRRRPRVHAHDRRARSRSTSSTAGSTTCSSTPRCSVPTRRSACPGLMRAWQAGNVAIANAPGAGVADDKVVYAWVPDLIRYYLGEEPLLPNVPTYRCLYEEERRFVLDNIGDLVVKPANESGGYGLLIGNRATASELDATRSRRSRPIRATGWPSRSCSLSTAPTLCDGAVAAAARRPAAVHPDRLAQLRDHGRATRVALPRARSSSTRRRAVAARTPGSSTCQRREAAPGKMKRLMKSRCTFV